VDAQPQELFLGGLGAYHDLGHVDHKNYHGLGHVDHKRSYLAGNIEKVLLFLWMHNHKNSS
jgi:hypothetical protein